MNILVFWIGNFELGNGYLNSKKGYNKTLKHIPTVGEDLLRIIWKYVKLLWLSKQKPEIK